MIVETSQSQILIQKKNERRSDFQTNNYQKRAQTLSIQEAYDALPVFYADKNYGGLDEVLHTGRDKVENDFMPAYPDANLWSNTHHIQVATVNPTARLVEGIDSNEQPVRYQTVQ